MTPRLIYLQHLFLSSCHWNCDECQPGFSIISIKLPVFPPPLLKLETSVLFSMGMGEHILPSSYNIKNYLEKLQIILLKKKTKNFHFTGKQPKLCFSHYQLLKVSLSLFLSVTPCSFSSCTVNSFPSCFRFPRRGQVDPMVALQLAEVIVSTAQCWFETTNK